ncbi:Acyl-CoA dehydrogenase [Streptomyces sp. MnatMP-M77]|nr:acyl-CoA dehydrogenase [Streptomyces sp. SID724]MYT83113.1 acyl-CoA dehydrogenase [Streptomyces sp. SID8364]NEB50740.1 acyl-CoA dehydrogenase [Streptomyces griseus]SBV03092.1 Acyl-CoA dehydrogenase [Streptomyces sp. MnatMP-M77]SCD76878.1 Acyl-CoA dehydrogenase [Streptomyces sp. OspMP-M43]
MSSAVKDEGSLSVDDVIERARGLVPLLRANAEKTERANAAVPENITALREAGLFRIPTPRSMGGLGLGLRAEVGVAAELARGCPSTGWLLMVNSAGRGLLQGMFPEDVVAEIYAADPDVSIANAGVGGVAAKAEGGYRLTADTAFASGCLHSAYTLVLLNSVTVDGEPQMALASVLVRTGDAEIKEVWDVAGMRGTGSNTVVSKDLFVADKHVAYHAIDPETGAPEGMGTSTHTLTASANVLAPLVGAAQGALDLIKESFDKGRPVFHTTHGAVADSPGARAWLAEATHHIDVAWRHLWLAVDQLEPALEQHVELSDEERTRIRMYVASAVREARQGLSKVMDLGGAGGFASANPLQRYFRDFETGSRHWTLNPFIALEDYGTALLGRAPLATIAL